MALLNKNYTADLRHIGVLSSSWDFLRVLQTCNLSIILFSSYAKSEINDQEVYLVQIEAESGKGKK